MSLPSDTFFDITPLLPGKMVDAIPVYKHAIKTLKQLDVPFVVTGGIPMLKYGRIRVTKDIDFLISKNDALRLLDELPAFGFKTQRTDDNWVYHAFKDGEIMDLLFALGKGFLGDTEGVVLSGDLLERAEVMVLEGEDFKVISPEDLIHSKLLVSWKATRQEDFQDVLLILRNGRALDWNYLLGKISNYPVRTLALLSYAASCQITEDTLPVELKKEVEDLSRSFLQWMGRAA